MWLLSIWFYFSSPLMRGLGFTTGILTNHPVYRGRWWCDINDSIFINIVCNLQYMVVNRRIE